MPENLVPTTRTVLTMSQFAEALLAVWPEATKEGAGVLWAHFAGETGSGTSCWNYNLGNVKHVRGDGHDYVALKGVWEGVAPDKAAVLVASGFWEPDPSADHAKAVGPGKVSILATPGNPATWFVAYALVEDGMAAFVKSKRTVAPTAEAPAPKQPRWEPVWSYVLLGDPEGYARELGHLGYYTASPNAYAAAMRARFTEWMASPAYEMANDEDPVTQDDDGEDEDPTEPGAA